MFDKKAFSLSECRSGADFENWVTLVLQVCGLNAEGTGRNDNGVDIIATKMYKDKEYKFYIQCKFYNRVLSKTPIQEVYTGHQFFGGDGYAVVFTNNKVTAEAKAYAKVLGVEIISELDLNEMFMTYSTKKAINSCHTGLMGIIISAILEDKEYCKKALENMQNPITNAKATDKNQLKEELINTFDKAEILLQESAELQMKASMYQQQALNLQKEALLKNLDYG